MNKRIFLRRVSKADFVWLHESVCDPSVHTQLGIDPEIIVKEVMASIVPAGPDSMNMKAYTAIALIDGERIGGAFLNRNELCYFVSAPYRGQGLGVELIDEACCTALETTRITQLCAKVLRSNVPSRLLLEKSGFHFAGMQTLNCGAQRCLAVLNYVRRIR
jgi:RimJ/RimL family protein N-acetyltransferase